MSAHNNYIKSEFAVIYSDMDYIPTIVIRGKAGATKHINITRAQLQAIEQVLCNDALRADQNTTLEQLRIGAKKFKGE